MSNIQFNFDGKTAIVTGGTRGIGAAITRAFLQAGANVIASYRSNDQAAQEFAESLGELKSKLHLKKFDISDAAAVETFFTSLTDENLTPSILINNGGIRKDNLVATMKENDWDDVLSTNLKGSFLMSQKAVMVFLRQRFGRIINISSIGGILGLPGQANYAASKAGQIAMTKSMSKEVAKKGITVNCIAPGFIATEMTATLPEEQIKEYTKQVPAKRFGESAEVANLALYLASEEAGYINGKTLEISGGL